ncbi:MAG: hypothetical protein O3B28_08605, partial [Proteobacteria bacterium]|nr:hypothetical protein [Pseudomonadota bacterium]
MTLLSNEYFNAEWLPDVLLTNIESDRFYFQSVHKTIKSLYFDTTALSNEEVQNLLASDERFTVYEDLKELLLYLMSVTAETSHEDITTHLNGFKTAHQGTALDTSKAKSEFGQLNANYGYFLPDDPDTEALFMMLSKASRARIIFIEKNNTPADTMAYEYAYKMMALCVDDIVNKTPAAWFQQISQDLDKLTRTLIDRKHCPYHEVLLTHLALPEASTVRDRRGWMKLIKTDGVRVFQAFGMSSQIEKKNAGAAPKNLTEAKTLLALCSYPRGAEDPEFAALCHKYRVSDARFNRSLDYIQEGWPKKIADNLPEVRVQAGKFTLSKLPVEDKRALIIGDITDCCQSIGGDSEQCVKESVSLSGNGIYIIQDRSKIIGQAYAWRSDAGNLCLDSIECLTHSIGNESLKQLLAAFATAVFVEAPSIKRVTLGAGGKTPENLYHEATPIPESIRQGYFYGDASRQYCIDKRPLPLTEQQQAAWDEKLASCPHTFQECMNYLCGHIEDGTQAISTLFLLLEKHPELIDQVSPANIQRFLFYSQSPAFEDLIPIDIETIKALPEAEQQKLSAARLVWNKKNLDELLEVLPFIHPSERLRALQNKGATPLLHLAAGNPESLRSILALLPEETRLEAVKEKDRYG